MKTTNTVSGISKFLFSTLVAATAMTSTAWAWDPDNDDYSIGSLDEFKAFRDYVNGTDKNGNTLKGKTVTLTANIDLKSEEWTPIGNSTYKFQGTFDGGNYTISNLKISGNNSNVGLFGFTTDGAIKNFTLNNAQVSGRLNVGAVAGTPYTSKYSNITLTGTVQVSGMAYVGGVGGKNAYANWDNVHVNVSGDSYVKANSVENGTAYRTYVGGVIGFMGEGSHTISNVSSNIKVEGSTVDVGGIVGIAHYGNNFVNVSCTAESIKLTNGGEAADATEVGAIAGVWHNGQSPDGSVKDVTFENCTVGENTVVEATYTDASGEKVTNTYDAEAVVYGAAYLASGEGTLNVSATGAKQYTYNATIASGVSESYDQIIIGSKTDVPESGSVVTVKGTLSDSSSNGGYFWIGSNTSDEAAKAKFGLVVDGGKVNVSNNEGMNIRPDGYLSIKNGGELNAPYISTKYATIDVDGEGSTLRVRTNNLVVKDDSVLTLSNSATLEMVNNTSEGRTANIEISDGGKIEMDHTSTVVFGGTISVAEGSSLTLDTTGFTGGAYKVFDYTGTAESMNYDFVTKTGEASTLAFNNDLYVTDKTQSTLYINSAYSESATGDVVNDNIVGYNAFANLGDIADKIATDGADTTIKFESDAEAGDVAFAYGDGDIVFTADKNVTISQNALASDWDFVVEGVSNTITIGENVTFNVYDNSSGLYMYYGVSLNIEGAVVGGQNWGCAYLFNGDHTVASTGTLGTGRVQVGFATLTVNGDANSSRTDAHVDTNYLLVEASTFTANNATVEAGVIHDSNNGGKRWGESEFNFNNSKLTAGGVYLKYGESVMNVKDSTVVVTTLENSGKISLTDSTLSVKDITNTGTFTMDGGTLEITGTATLGGTVSINADEVILAGTISVDALTTKVLTIAESDVVINITGVSAVMTLSADEEAGTASSGLSFDTLKFTIDDANVGVGDGLELSSLIKDEATLALVQSQLEDGESITIENTATGVTYTDCVYSDGAIAVPEPSAFGLLAGLGAIALAVSRRRRNRR